MLGEALSVATALLWAASTILSAEALKEIDPLSANIFKTFFSAVSMLPIAFAMGEIQNMSKVSLYGLISVILAVMIGFGIGDTFLFESITLIGVSRSYTIAYTYPLFTMALATLFLGEPFLLKYLLGTVIIFLGIITILTSKNSDDAKDSSKGLLEAFATAISWSVATILIATGLKEISVVSANAIRYPFLFLFLLVFSRWWRKKPKVSRGNLALSAASGVLGMTLGGITFLYGIQLIGVSRATPLCSSAPVWASLMSSLFLKEKLTWRIVASSLMVVAGSYFLA